MARSIWVIAEVADGKLSRITTEVATAARGIAEQAGRDVVGVVVGADPGKPAEELARFVPRVLSVADPVTDGHASATLLAERVAALAADEPPDYLLLGAGPEGRDAAGVLSVLLGWPVLANATGLGALLAGRVETGPRQVLLEPVGVRFGGDELELSARKPSGAARGSG